MKKAVIATGGRQYVVAEGDELTVNLLADTDKKTVSFDALMVVDGKNSIVGTPIVPKVSVTAEVVTADQQAEKVVAIRYKSKKRVHKIRGHRQRQTTLKITAIK